MLVQVYLLARASQGQNHSTAEEKGSPLILHRSAIRLPFAPVMKVAFISMCCPQHDLLQVLNSLFLPHLSRHAASAQQLTGTSHPEVAALIRLWGLVAVSCAAPPLRPPECLRARRAEGGQQLRHGADAGCRVARPS